jgi:hypothetical protein
VSSSPIRSDDDEVRQRHHHLQHQSQGFGKLSKAELFRRQQIYPAGQKLLHGIVATNYASRANKDCIVNIQIRVVNSRLHQVIQRAHMGTQSMDTFSTMQDSVNWHLVVKPSLHLAHRPVVLDCQGKRSTFHLRHAPSSADNTDHISWQKPPTSKCNRKYPPPRKL